MRTKEHQIWQLRRDLARSDTLLGRAVRENEQFRAALGMFADEDNWREVLDEQIDADYQGWDNDEHGDEPWKIAQDALKGREGDDE